MAKSIQAIRGMRDILPSQTPLWQFLETQVQTILKQYGYAEIRTPLVEHTALFKRSIGEVTDIVEKEMYTFSMNGGDSLTLRPEGTASCVRAGLEHGLLYNQIQRLWYQGAMFRHEKPQKGRYRQFQQIGVETYGMAGPDIDLELIIISAKIWQKLGLKNLELQLNSLGTMEERAAYKIKLVEYFEQQIDLLDKDSLRRLKTNPLRILDSKNPALTELIKNSPSLMDSLGAESKQHFNFICDGLTKLNIPFTLNSRLVRGLDYYSLTVFEWVTTELGTQGTVCAGGRYDSLIEQLNGKATTAVGFAMGVDRLIDLLEIKQVDIQLKPLDAYLILLGDHANQQKMILAEKIRQVVPNLTMQVHCGSTKIKAQLKKADQANAQFAFIIGDDEIDNNEIIVKPLRTGSPQQTIDFKNLAEFINT